MNTIACPVCGGGTVRNGRTAAGAQRWLCRACGATTTHRIDNSAKLLSTFLDWLFSSNTQDGVRGMSARTFRRKCARFWRVWPLPRPTGEVHRVVFVDGIRIARNVCVLIASTERHVIGWYLARSENSRAWKALMAPIPPPDMVVTDGGTGFGCVLSNWGGRCWRLIWTPSASVLDGVGGWFSLFLGCRVCRVYFMSEWVFR